MERAGVICGLGAGIAFMVIVSIAVAGLHPKPPDMFLVLDGKRFKAGYGAFGGSEWVGGSFFEAEVDSSRTLPHAIINATNGTQIQFLSPGHVNPVLSQAYLYDLKWHNQFPLEQISDNTFKVTDDVTKGDYIISVFVQYREGMIGHSYYHHKVRIL